MHECQATELSAGIVYCVSVILPFFTRVRQAGAGAAQQLTAVLHLEQSACGYLSSWDSEGRVGSYTLLYGCCQQSYSG
ncbi:hypothetical protein AMECASPLE_028741 [Ameca splendens]|uniref:Uncharacterized protein n=1 Tax=Ameca splendens TaxID=208324 RepID=A0ABV0YSV2_9TELE